MRRLPLAIFAAACLAALGACTQTPQPRDADVIVVGAGIAGLSAALEASAQGATVLVLDANSVGGGHAVKAGGFALVDTQLQRDKGISDSPDLAWRDLMRWGEDPDPYWTRRYAEASGAEVYDWLTQLGVEFVLVMPTPESSVPRFHFTAGTAVNAVVPMMRKALVDPRISFRWNTRVIALNRNDGRITGVVADNERNGNRSLLRAQSVVLATGGFQNNLRTVRENWATDEPPERLLRGAGHFATGDGYRLADWAGADMVRMSDQVTFYTGVPDPRDLAGEKGFHAQNAAAVWLNQEGRRFVNESGDHKQVKAGVDALEQDSFWMFFDAGGARKFSVRGQPWINRDTIRSEFLDNPEITIKADSLDELARAMGIPPHNIHATVEIWNRMIEVGADYQLGRFDTNTRLRGIGPVATPPYYAVRVYPLTRKSMGGPAINARGEVINAAREPIAGLYAAGELSGVAGINGRHGGSGTFLGPSVLTGRVAGRSAALRSDRTTTLKPWQPPTLRDNERGPGKPGYWHFDAVHRTVSEQSRSCDTCHTDNMPMAAATERYQMLAQLDTCTDCH